RERLLARGRIPHLHRSVVICQRQPLPVRANPQRRGPRAAQPAERRDDLPLLPEQHPRLAPEKRAEHMRTIERNAARAEEVIATLTDFARAPAPEMKPFADEQCVRKALEDSVVPGRIESVVDFPADLPPALADLSQIRIVLRNLI